ncbi:MAG: NAD(+)/NADH kinase [bacterium]|nr:NAD(+)/NADH kinase [bacterium]MDE0669521.1 NAD(+)/NADH kinase [bacterium]MXZ29556.1 NAD(+)/NADH kinase [Acidimicrobiia bacterium]MYB25161.1 NAD(+)/NADH kinase [Acidimicrobiia bacterium]MYJ13299.1 NAD(+)/NADH kinase [Acidimicrobiia bacterium]
MARFALVVHPRRPPARLLAQELAGWLAAEGHEVRLPGPDAASADLADLACADAEVGGADLVVSLGGDGSILRAVRLAADAGVAVLGVNFGQLAYLAELEPGDARGAIGRWLAGEFEIVERMRLAVRVRADGGDYSGPPLGALNEAVVEKLDRGRSVRLSLSVDGRHFATYRADGLIVASPTGSTAYSLSVRGPILAPTHQALVVTPVSPHSLFDRSLVLPPATDLRLEVTSEQPAALSLDGDVCRVLSPGGVVECTASARPARLVSFSHRRFDDILKAKFALGDR